MTNTEDTHNNLGDNFHKVNGHILADRITATVTHAFRNDPTWSPLLGADTSESGPAYQYWSLFVHSALRYPWSYSNHDGTVTSIWYPPNADELTPEETARFPEFATELLGAHKATELFRTIERFDDARPAGAYFYLSLLAVHPTQRGSGLGLRLLAENLQVLDALGVPTYLESSNPQNDEKYRRLGYQQHGTIALRHDFTITTFWRDPAVGS
ncbi:MAG: GNAT family N-acetyltransferase [Actinobacteria bacterium]|nr:GNAT family N-acetyltransferase [Actinomycetota bacterium]